MHIGCIEGPDQYSNNTREEQEAETRTLAALKGQINILIILGRSRRQRHAHWLH